MPFYNPNELSNYGQDITDLQDAQVNRLVDRAIAQPTPPQGTPSPVPGGGVPPGLAAALIQQLSQQQQQQPPQSLGEVLRHALQIGGETMKTAAQTQAGINPNLNNPTTLRNALLQKAAIQQLIEERMLNTQHQQQQAAQDLARQQFEYEKQKQGIIGKRQMDVRLTPPALPGSTVAKQEAETGAITQKLPGELALQGADLLAKQEQAAYDRRFNALLGGGLPGQGGGIAPPTGGGIESPDVMGAPGNAPTPGLAGALQSSTPSQQPAPRLDTLNLPHGRGTLKFPEDPAVLADRARQASEAKALGSGLGKQEVQNVQMAKMLPMLKDMERIANDNAGSARQDVVGDVSRWVGGKREELKTAGYRQDERIYEGGIRSYGEMIAHGVLMARGAFTEEDRLAFAQAFPKLGADSKGTIAYKFGILRSFMQAHPHGIDQDALHGFLTDFSRTGAGAPSNYAPQNVTPPPGGTTVIRPSGQVSQRQGTAVPRSAQDITPPALKNSAGETVQPMDQFMKDFGY